MANWWAAVCRGRAAYRKIVDTHTAAAQTPLYALSLACGLAAWTAGGDMTLVLPALAIGYIFALIGLSLQRHTNKLRFTILSVFISVPFVMEAIFLRIHFHQEIANALVDHPLDRDLPHEYRAINIEDLFRSDFSTTYASLQGILPLKDRSGQQHAVPFRLFEDMTNRIVFMSFFVDPAPDGVGESLFIVDNIPFIRDFLTKSVSFVSKDPGEPAFDMAKSPISSTIYIYMKEDFDIENLAIINNKFAERGKTPIFRGSAYQALHMNETRTYYIPKNGDKNTVVGPGKSP